MGEPVDVVGRIAVVPPLNSTETQYLDDVVRSPRPPGSGQPGPACPWVVTDEGRSLMAAGSAAVAAPAEWLRYLILHLLKPGARAARSGDPGVADFTFDHLLYGVVAGYAAETGELFTITVRGTRVARRTLRRPDPPSWPELMPRGTSGLFRATSRSGKVIDLGERRRRRA